MLKILIVIIANLIAIGLKSQNSFELLIRNNNSQTLSDVVELCDESFVFVGWQYEPASYENIKGLLIKINQNGIIVKNTIIESFWQCQLLNIHLIEDQIYVLAFVKEFESSNQKLALFRFDLEIELLDYHLNNISSSINISRLNSIVDSNENLTIFGYGMPYVKFYYKMSLNGDSITSQFTSSSFDNLPHGIIENLDENSYSVFIEKHINGWSSKVNLTQDLEIIDTLTFGNPPNLPDSLHYTYFVSPVRMQDGSIFASGVNKYSSFLKGVFLIKISNSDQITKQKYLESPTQTNHAIYYSNSTYLDNYYAAFTSNFNSQTTFSMDTSHINIIKLDDELETIWHKTIGGSSYKVLFRILATRDGGCILSIYNYEHDNNFENKINAYIVKLDKNGELLWNNKVYSKSLVSLYPSPANDELFLEIDDFILVKDLVIFDISGEVILSQTKIQSPLNTNNLSNGVYILRLNTNIGFITKKFSVLK